MQTFTDTQGRVWTISIGFATARRLSDQTDGRIDFIEQARTGQGKEIFETLANDMELLGQVAWLLCEAQAEEAGVSELDFAEAFDMDVLDKFQTALIRAAIDFFPSRSREVLKKALQLAEQIAEKDNAEISEKAAQLMEDPQFEQMIRKAMRRTPGDLSGSGPDTSNSGLVISSTLDRS